MPNPILPEHEIYGEIYKAWVLDKRPAEIFFRNYYWMPVDGDGFTKFVQIRQGTNMDTMYGSVSMGPRR